jgi:hypothetical protein
MKGLTIAPLHWSRLPDLREAAPLDGHDLACMVEVRDVLARHGRLDRFALHLVHKHFELRADEVLVEYSDPATREQWQRVEPRISARLQAAVPTTWMLAAPTAPLAVCVCAYRIDQGHLGRHRSE